MILLIEDDKEQLLFHERLLKSSGYMVFTASDGFQGLELLSMNKGIINVILLDLLMPTLDGLEILKAIRDNPMKYGNPSVIILTSMRNEKIIQDSFALGASSYLIKSEVTEEELKKEIAKYLEKDV